ncbi:MAG: Protein tas [Gammaproteobacteria bacterium]|nr:Protein tas [Gammaproteobacteria bacterium]
MKLTRLGGTDLQVSRICLGTMNWGEQNSESEAQAQLDYAVGQGINFIDTAELYPVPQRAETYGRTEEIIGRWLRARRNREQVVLATKICGRADWVPWIRGSRRRLDRANIQKAVDCSLKRLKTDYIDLYQLHWPDRDTNYFGKLGYTPGDDGEAVPIEETLCVLRDFVRIGKIRHVGVCNETPWGVMTALAAAARLGLPRLESIQNPYSLLNRTFEIGLAEIAHREQVGLLAYSPLGFGVLSGKYTGGTRPAGARLTLFDRFRRYLTPAGEAATLAYVALARRHGMEPAQLALAFVNSRPFLTSTIIGASRVEQLADNIASIDRTLSAEVLAEIEGIHQRHPNPCP